VTETSERAPAPKAARTLRSSIGEVGRLVRPTAALALFTMLLAQGVSPSIKTAGLAVGRVIDYVDLAAGISSHLLALTVSALSIGLLLIVGRDPRVSLVARVLLVAQTTIVLVLAVPASRFRLSPFACFFLGVVACSAAMAGSFEGLREPRTRALGMVLGLVGLAGTTRVVSAGLVAIPTATQAGKLAPLSNALSTGSVLLHGVALMVALAWLASRRRKTVSVGSMAALIFAMAVTWVAGSGAQVNAPTWMIFVARFQEELIPLPLSAFPRVVDGFVAVLGPIVAVAALLSRRQVGTVVGAVTLALTAGTVVDVPGHAIVMVLAALATALAAHDEQGMWEALMGKRLEGSQSGEASREAPAESPAEPPAAEPPPENV